MKIDTNLNARSAEFQVNATAMRALVDDLHAQFAKVEAGDCVVHLAADTVWN